jgi:acetylornithine deacetylase/succinyl-diaminopimelate desuccinylase-like protein
VLPAKASTKVSFRLVEGQDPERVRAAFHAHAKARLPADCKISFTAHGGSRAGIMRIDDPAFEAARTALSDEWPEEAAYVGCGGSIPIAGHFGTVLGMNAMLIGFGKDDDAIHSPNEKYDMESFHKGTRSWARILDALC